MLLKFKTVRSRPTITNAEDPPMDQRATIPDLHVVPRAIELPRVPGWDHRFTLGVALVTAVAASLGTLWGWGGPLRVLASAGAAAVIAAATSLVQQWRLIATARFDRAIVSQLSARPLFVADLQVALEAAGEARRNRFARLRERLEVLVADGWLRVVDHRYALASWGPA